MRGVDVLFVFGLVAGAGVLLLASAQAGRLAELVDSGCYRLRPQCDDNSLE